MKNDKINKKMKALIALLLSVSLVMTFVGCKNNSKTVSNASESFESGDIPVESESFDSNIDSMNGENQTDSLKDSSTLSTNSNKTSTNNASQSGQISGTTTGGTNLNGRSVKVLMLGQGKAFPDPDSDSYERNVKRIKYVEAKYNCKLVFNTDHSFPAIKDYIVTNVTTGKDFADIAWAAPWYVASPFVTQNIAVPLDQYIDFNQSTLKNMKLQNWGKFFGKHFTMAVGNGGTSCVLLYNKDIFKASNGKLEDPFDLMQKGQWTWDKFLQIARDATVRDADNKVTQWGVVSITGGEFLNQICASNNVNPIEYNGDVFTLNYSDKKLTEVLTFCNQIANEYKCGLLTTGIKDAKVDGTKDWKQGRAAMCFSTLGLAKTYAPANCGMVLCPRGPSSDKCYAPAYGGTAYMVPVTSKIPATAAKIMYDLFADWDTSMPGAMDSDEINEFQNGSQSSDLAFGKNDFVTLGLTITNARLSYSYYFNDVGNSFDNTVYNSVIFKNSSISTALDTYRPAAQLLVTNMNNDLAAAKQKYGIK